MEQRVQKLETVLGSDPTHLVSSKNNVNGIWIRGDCALQVKLEFGNIHCCAEGGKLENPEKNLGARTTPPTYGVNTGNHTRAMLVGGKCSHQCTIPDPYPLFSCP